MNGATKRSFVATFALVLGGSMVGHAGTDDRPRRHLPVTEPTFRGQWISNYGPIDFHSTGAEDGSNVRATYVHGGGGTIDGLRRGAKLDGRYKDQQNQGLVEFELVHKDRIDGRFQVAGTKQWHNWHAFRRGSRAGFADAIDACQNEPAGKAPSARWDGAWTSSYGPITLSQDGSLVTGSYTMNGRKASVTGRIIGACLAVQYVERDAAGVAVWSQDTSGETFKGRWRQYGKRGAWSHWTGRRPRPVPQRRPKTSP